MAAEPTQIKSREVPPDQPLALQGDWTIYVSFEHESSFVISFTATRIVNDKMEVVSRLPVLVSAMLRQQLLCTHDWAWRLADLPVNPSWETDFKVLVGSNAAKFRNDYVQQLIGNFNGACRQRNLTARMILRTAKVAMAGASARTAKSMAPPQTTASSTNTTTDKKATPKKAVAKKGATKSPRKKTRRTTR